MKNEIILYQTGELPEHIEVRLENETVWLTQTQMAILFGQTKQNISLHINNCFKENELDSNSVVKKTLTTAKDGKRYNTKYYNLDVIISVGYRVKSKQGTQFRIWATQVLKEYLLKGYALNQRMDRIENNVENITKALDKISIQIRTQELPKQGIFFDGQIFDAYAFASQLIQKAKKEIILIDNYIDESTLTHLTKKAKHVKVLLLTNNISDTLALDLKKANAQFGNFEAKILTSSHDRFLILDKKELYHLGASLKDLGKRWFAFSKLDDNILAMILAQLNQKET
jgi:hypothetical protein